MTVVGSGGKELISVMQNAKCRMQKECRTLTMGFGLHSEF
jgi:hypothetical protein